MTSPHISPTTLLRVRLRTRHLAALSAATALALASPAPANAEVWGGLNADQSVTYFSSPFALAPGDTNSTPDLYASDGTATTLVSGGTIPGDSTFRAASEDGAFAYFFTSQPIAPDDHGDSVDIYVRTPTGIQRITPAGKTASMLALADITPDGTRAWIHTTGQFVPSDTDSASDLYEYRPADKSLALLTPGTTADVHFAAGSTDGTTVWLGTFDALEPGDTDGKMDVYRRKNGSYLRMTPGNGPHHAHAKKVGRTTETLLFETSESLLPSDADTEVDIYRRVGAGPVELVTTSSAGAASESALFLGSDPEGSRVVYRTTESLVAADTDTRYDIYAVKNGFRTLLSDGPDDPYLTQLVGITDDASTVLMQTASPLLASDTDSMEDLYRFHVPSATMTHVNPTNNGFTPTGATMATTSGAVAWQTAEPLSAHDTDTFSDVYVHTPALGIKLVSARPVGSPVGGPQGTYVVVHAVLPDGDVLFSTPERLLSTDKDDLRDLYEFSSGTLVHVSRDTSPPDTSVEAPSTAAEGENFQVQAGSTEQGTLECRVDTSDWFACPLGTSNVGPLAAGTHTFQARATDVAGNVDPTPATATVVVPPAAAGGTTPTDPALPGAGGAVTDSVAPRLTDAKLRLRRGAPTLSLRASEAASVAVRLQRRVDGRWRTVRSLTKGLAAGPHHLKLARRVGSGKHRAVVVATDPTGNAAAPLKVALRR